jgi:hypothetical protein
MSLFVNSPPRACRNAKNRKHVTMQPQVSAFAAIMSFSCQAARSQAVTLVLAGRTTLSEHSPTESIEVAYELAKLSPYLRNFLPQRNSSDRVLLPIQLGDVDPAGFRLYINWLATGSIEPPSHSPLFLRSCTDLIYAHIVGATFNAPHFQDQAIDVLSHIVDPAQAPDLKVLEILFLEKHASGMLKRFVIDKMFALDRKMLGMLRGFVEDMVTGKSDVKGCEYHVHEEGICYKSGREDRGEIEKNCGATEKRWSIDDDAELNALAAHYLGKTCSTTEHNSKALTASARPGRSMTRVLMDGNLTVNLSAAPSSTRSNSRTMHTSSLHYQGSAAWSRDMRSPKASRQSFDAQLDLDKPLPPPPPPPSRQPPPPPSFVSPPATETKPTDDREPVKPTSTQDFVLECLVRLSPTSPRLSTRDLIDECLARVPSRSNAVDTADSDDGNNDDDDDNSIQSSTSLHSRASSSFSGGIPPSLRPGPLSSPPPINRDFSFAPLPKPRFPAPPPPAARISPPLTPPYHLSSTPDLPPLIKRKPAPPRGTDWLEQWDRLHALQGTQGFGLRKHNRMEKKSKFKGMLGSVKV